MEEKIISLTPENIAEEDICCAISDKKHQNGVAKKKEWLANRFAEGMRFKKFNIRGKLFIEYMPAEYSWRPVIAPGYMLIQCFWVSGRYKGHGYGAQLLNACEEDAKTNGFKGVVAVSNNKTFLSPTKYFLGKGYEKVDKAPPNFDLVCKKFDTSAETPYFSEAAKNPQAPEFKGLTLYFSDQCPFVSYYLEEINDFCTEAEIPFNPVKINSRGDVLKLPCGYGTYALFFNGDLISYAIPSIPILEKLLKKYM